MASVVFDLELDQKTLKALGDMRDIRLQVLKKQVTEIDETLYFLVQNGALKSDEVSSYRKEIIGEINHKLHLLEERMEDPSTIYSDELEMYLELLSSP